MTVEQIMKRPVRTCRSEDSLDAAAQMMWEADCGSLPVLDGEGRVVAMITDRDICMGAHFQSGTLRSLKVGDVMSKALHACKPTDSLSEAEALMRSKQIRRLPIVDENDRPIGVLSLNDIALEAGAEARSEKKQVTLAEVGQILGAICKHRELAMAASA